ncbi:alternative ribosome rescue aminoacyl-tRNA hydrolase ArfB [Varunaivibrio sulfuroxidans]|uniref:Ribosome-associated protein n=1 Tax=Varunaivibrio sulfuroxidans TaxID=1773489 RepID=A0A4R3JEC5_9PROT|nr:alternative ribosome rescue aminoacyl-tRNA hydrolase ArfB [Varunaivibrio sulfuroxidans]TCS63446.1 ribosome-associated protein [Varunaivibrio sulfuroxidans]WES30408.1 alternative ribosome rescue aminoacyl-tRNA hydrolase ArfB [Varunaivibrio sulfuroxidans]
MIEITPSLSVPDEAIEWRFVRASGPGGQNVNKVSSAVQLRFNVGVCADLGSAARARLKVLAGRRMTKEGVIVIGSDRFRSQERNRIDALQRLRDLIVQAMTPRKHRRATKPSKAAKARRLQGKLHRGGIKKGRAKPGRDDI